MADAGSAAAPWASWSRYLRQQGRNCIENIFFWFEIEFSVIAEPNELTREQPDSTARCMRRRDGRRGGVRLVPEGKFAGDLCFTLTRGKRRTCALAMRSVQ